MRDAAVGHQCVECVSAGAQTVRQPRTQAGGRLGTTTPVLTYGLIAVNVLAFIAQMASSSAGELGSRCGHPRSPTGSCTA